VDTTVAGALLGAVVSVACVLVGWYLRAHEERRRQKERTVALSGALLMETVAAAWHVLNTKEVLERSVEEDWVLTPSSMEYYFPSSCSIYASVIHEIANLGAAVARALVEFHTHLDRALGRTRRICALDGRRLKKKDRLSSLKECASDWGYVAWAGSESMAALLPLAKPTLTQDQLENVEFYMKMLYAARQGERWSLPDDLIELRPVMGP
jgi:hypothetical protein